MLLIMLGFASGYSQSIEKDTLVLNDDDFEDPIFYGAEDSIYTDVKNEVIHLYKAAFVDNGDVRMDAGYIMIDLKNNEVLAAYRYDEDSNMVELPHFTDGGDEITAQKIRYNFKTEKAFIEELAIQQDENFLYMGVAKRQANEEIHFLKGRFTSCNLEEPHYHFQLSKAVMVPDKRIVSGPMNLWILGVPTPLGLPFSIIPQMEDKTQGLMFPEIVMPSTFGFGFKDLGYYIPINDNLQTTVYGSLYSRGSWGVRNRTDYAKRYRYTGYLDLGFQQFRRGFPDSTFTNKSTVQWQHSKDVKSNPYWNFRSNVNFQSDNDTKNNLDPNNDQYFNNSLNSDIIISRNFPGKPLKMGAKLSLRQNSISENVSLSSPVINANMTRIFPFKKVIKPGKSNGLKELLRSFSVTYNFEGQNRATFGDSLIPQRDFAGINSSFMNGISQDTKLQTTASVFKNTLKITPSLSYNNYMNFQQIERDYDLLTSTVNTDTTQQFGMAHDLRINASMTTVLYSYYRYIGKNKPILRHVMTPSLSYSFRPNLNTVKAYITATDTIEYSPFENSLYSIRSTSNQQIVTFGINNTFELKRKSEKDTVDGFKRTRIIDALSITGSYDIEDTITPLSDISMSMRISPISFLNIVTNVNFSPYNWNDTTGATLTDYAIQSDRNTLGRFTTVNLTTSLTFTSKKGRERLKNAVDNIDQNWNADYNYYYLHPEEFLDFEIPWKMTFSHVYTISANQNISEFNSKRLNQVQTLMMQADVSFTKRWKISTRTNLDLMTTKITNSRVSLVRNMHCWMLSFDWTPIGLNKSFVFSLRSTSPLLQDVPINLRKPPTFL